MCKSHSSPDTLNCFHTNNNRLRIFSKRCILFFFFVSVCRDVTVFFFFTRIRFVIRLILHFPSPIRHYHYFMSFYADLLKKKYIFIIYQMLRTLIILNISRFLTTNTSFLRRCVFFFKLLHFFFSPRIRFCDDFIVRFANKSHLLHLYTMT